MSGSALSKKMAGFTFLFKWQGLPNFTKDFWVCQALKGYRRTVGQRDARRPVLFDILRGIIEHLKGVCASAYEVWFFRVAFLLAFFGAFRISELVSPSKKVQGGIWYQDVLCREEEVSLLLHKSKTDQGGKGKRVTFFSLPGSPMCPVRAVRGFLEERPVQFVTIFRKCVWGLGLEEKEFSSHSFRIGAATEAARCGIDDESVKRIGRWVSQRFRLYIRPQLLVGQESKG